MMKEGNFSHPLKSPSIDPKELVSQPVNLFSPNFGVGVLPPKLSENDKLSAPLPPVISIVGNTGSCSPLQYDYGHTEYPLSELNRSSVFSTFMQRRPRGEKRPIPDEQKDEKYYERRKRNNEAAKKSRDARKIREDRIAFRAALLEQENSILRAQIVALRNELQSVRQMMASGPADRQPQIQ